MGIYIRIDDIHTYGTSKDFNWAKFYPKLLSTAKCFVYLYRIPCWWGQEEDIAEDVAQETIRRTIERINKSARGMASPIGSLEHMMVVIARNYVLDMRRHDRRVIRLPSEADVYEIGIDVSRFEDMPEMAIENVYQEWLFLQIAHEVACLPFKQRRAILIDLANRMSFNIQPTPLEVAFLAVDIDLQEYQIPLSEDPVERARHASLVSLAYKRVTHLLSSR
jgi:hypothetical protein